jgi:hypothetical protein
MRKLLFNLLLVSLVICGLTESKVSAQRMATITGSLSYPTDAGLPKMIVCAEAVNAATIHCTDKRIPNRRSGKMTYKLTVPAGTYYVFATVVNGETLGEGFQGYKAYYSEFVTCGLSVNCPSHAPIKVTLRAGQTSANIDPGDWYANN